MTTISVGFALAFATLVGVGLASGTFSQPLWADALNVSSGALVVEGHRGLRGFGKFLGVLVALGLGSLAIFREAGTSSRIRSKMYSIPS
jgi:hypothetical protein